MISNLLIIEPIIFPLFPIISAIISFFKEAACNYFNVNLSSASLISLHLLPLPRSPIISLLLLFLPLLFLIELLIILIAYCLLQLLNCYSYLLLLLINYENNYYLSLFLSPLIIFTIIYASIRHYYYYTIDHHYKLRLSFLLLVLLYQILTHR